MTTGVDTFGVPDRRQQPGDGRSPPHHRYDLLGRHEFDAAVAVPVVAPVHNDDIHWQAAS